MATGLSYQVTADTKAAVAELKKLQSTVRAVSTAVRRDIQGINTALGGVNATGLSRVRTSLQSNVTNPLNAAARAAQNASRSINTSLNGIAPGASRGSAAIASFKGNLMAMIALQIGAWAKQAVGHFTEMSDAATNAQSRLQLAISNWGNYGRAQQDVLNISRITRSELNATSTLYGKLAITGKTLDASQQQVARAAQTVTTALKVSGASAQETTSTVLQLGQALSSGKLNGDEFRSLAENAPRLMQLLADSMNVPVGALKKMASNGELTSDKLFKAFNDKKFTAALDEELKRMPKTFGDGFTAITNVAGQTFAAFNQGGQFSQSLYDFADQGQTNMATIVKAARDAGGEMRDSFAGLRDAFQPLLEGASGVFDALGIKVQSLKEQIAGLLGMMDDIANAPIRLQNFANRFDNNVFGTNKPIAPLQNMRGDFLKGYAESRRGRARERLIGGVQRYTGNYKFNAKGLSDQQLLEYSRTAKPAAQGGSGNLRAPPGTGGNDPNSKALAKHQKTLADLQKLEQSATGASLARIQKRADREKQIIANLQKGVGEAAASAAAPSGSGSGKTKEQREAERAAKKYADALQDLINKKNDLSLTDDQRELADALEAAGLERNIKLTGKKADEVRKLVASLQEAEKGKKLADTLKELKEKNEELSATEEQRALIEARVAAGLPRDLKTINDKTRAIDAQALANYRLEESNKKKQEDKGKAEGVENELKSAKEQTDEKAAVRADADKSPLQQALNAIDRVRLKRIQLLQSLQIEESLRAKLIAQTNQQAEAEQKDARAEDQLNKVERVSDLLVNLWDNPKEAMKGFFKEMLKNLLMNIAKATILKKLMPGGGGGSIGGIIGNAVSSALGFGGGRAVGGGVDSSKFYLVGEKGPELFAPGRTGTIIPNRNMGGGSTSISLGETHISIQGGANDNTIQQMNAQMDAHRRMTVQLVRKEIERSKR